MYAPASHDEITTLTRYADQQLEAIRASAFGLTAEQFRSTPCRSALSIAALVKHSAYGLRGAARRLTADPMTPPELDQASFVEYGDSFTVVDDDPESLLAEFDAARTALRDALEAVDPDTAAVDPPAPWHGVMDPQPIRWRYYLVHMIEELARHAGHADILREEIDGQSVPTLVLTLGGAPANAYFTPFEPPPGTIGAS